MNEFFTFDPDHSGRMHQSPTSKKLQQQLSDRLLNYGKQINDKKEKLKQANEEQKSKKSRNHMKLSKTSKTFEQFYENQIRFQQKKWVNAQVEVEKQFEEEKIIKKLR